MDKVRLLSRVFSCIDNTTLEGCDTREKVIDLCRDSLAMSDAGRGIASVASVCVYPIFVRTARKALVGSDIRVASVAGAFPSGQSPLEVKLHEVRYAVEEGAQEIDMVISRGALIEGDERRVVDEVAAIREVCRDVKLKVILETGELPSLDLVERAALLAIEGGADFIKTSTGKIATGATLDAAGRMLKVIAQTRQISGKMVGFKAAGGIRTVEQALDYAMLAIRYMGEEYIDKQYFRIGASSLTNRVYSFLTQ